MGNVIPNINKDKYEAGIKLRQNETSGAKGSVESSDRSLEYAVKEVRGYLTTNYPEIFENTLNDSNARGKIKDLIGKYVEDKAIKVDGIEGLEETIAMITSDIINFGPITEFLDEEKVEEIRVNSPDDIRIVIKGKEYTTDKRFSSMEQAITIAKKIVRNVGKGLSPSEPIVDARLKNGQRVAVVIDPVALTGINLIIRKQKSEVFTTEKLISFGTGTEEMFEFLDIIMEADVSCEVIGPTNSGKTATMQTILSRLPNDKRTITMEDTAELNLRKHDEKGRPINNVVMWETKEGVTNLLDLLKQSLRQSPETMVLGEMRGEEAQTVVAAANTGHQIINSFHANGPKDAPTRVLQMYMMGKTTLTQDMILDMIISAFPICVFQKKMKDGSRKIMSISELEGYDENKKLIYREIYKFKVTGSEIYDEIHPLTNEPYQRKVILGKHYLNSNISRNLYERLIEEGIDKELAEKYYKGPVEKVEDVEGEDD
ncbi:CpaF family protein [Alkaliphilus peptidifermentans]|uniref:Pilus assembly protein CpaF n=1 Tax=Alkaliphilus peptidifermentans DSM 18978 TaxID=1120976 RepID=A0A1G5DTA3_9FIRM|nr:ATPase, T2SS/T4P/T4SS family [Alkaliphilus peptidifermentans]SCY18033.1 pilus assembly protein CpaF [Alkaliphilus peptidifermentans DSM 18978]